MGEAQYFIIDLNVGKIVSKFTKDEKLVHEWYKQMDGVLKGGTDLQICKTIYG